MNSTNKGLIYLSAVCPLLIVLSVFLGDGWRQPLSLFGPDRAGILELRLWRVTLGMFVGASLAAAGAALQALLRNPLAEPYILGVSSGAGLATAVCIALGGWALGAIAIPLAGFIGAFLSLIAVFSLARIGQRTSPHTLILAGVAWGSFCGSVLMFLVSQSSAEGIHTVVWWFLGDLQVYDRRLVQGIVALMTVALVALSYFGRQLNAMILGDEQAGHLGLHPERIRIMTLGLASILAASCVSASGLIAFVGLVIPHAARALAGADHRRLIPAAALLGAAFLTVADGLGRTLLYPVEIPVGIFTALIGAPFFLHLLRRRQKEIWL